MKIKFLLLFLAVSGCGTSSLPVNETFTARQRATLGNEFETNSTLIRSFKINEAGERIEIEGAVCTASNALVSVRNVSTPARVSTPMYLQAERFSKRGKPPALNWRCSYQGKVVKLTSEASSGRGHTISYGASTYNAATGTYSQPTSLALTGRLSTTLPWAYPNIEVEF